MNININLPHLLRLRSIQPSLQTVAFLLLSVAIAACSTSTTETAIEAPSVTAPVNKAVEDEGKVYVMEMAKQQDAYWRQHDKFAATIDDLGIRIYSETESYRYAVEKIYEFEVHITAVPNSPGLRSYIASVFVIGDEVRSTRKSIVCESDAPSQTPPDLPPTPRTPTDLFCASGSSQVAVSQ